MMIWLSWASFWLVALQILLGPSHVYAASTFYRRQADNVPSSMNVPSKAGLGWGNGANISLKQFEGTGRVTWYYTWSVYPVDNNIEFVPMFWGNTSINTWTTTAKQVLQTMTPKVTAVLGMNEPELASQANLTVEEGIELWKAYVEPLRASGYRLGSPGPSSSPTGKTWLQNFITACNDGCTLDFIPLHWYGTNATAFQQHVEDYRDTFQRPIWVTEWACQDYVNPNNVCSLDDVVSFMNATQTYLDGVDFVERYAWFGAQEDLTLVNNNNALMDQNGIINDLGKQYINYTDADGPINTSLPTFTTTSSASRSSPTNMTFNMTLTDRVVRYHQSTILFLISILTLWLTNLLF